MFFFFKHQYKGMVVTEFLNKLFIQIGSKSCHLSYFINQKISCSMALDTNKEKIHDIFAK